MLATTQSSRNQSDQIPVSKRYVMSHNGNTRPVQVISLCGTISSSPNTSNRQLNSYGSNLNTRTAGGGGQRVPTDEACFKYINDFCADRREFPSADQLQSKLSIDVPRASALLKKYMANKITSTKESSGIHRDVDKQNCVDLISFASELPDPPKAAQCVLSTSTPSRVHETCQTSTLSNGLQSHPRKTTQPKENVKRDLNGKIPKSQTTKDQANDWGPKKCGVDHPSEKPDNATNNLKDSPSVSPSQSKQTRIPPAPSTSPQPLQLDSPPSKLSKKRDNSRSYEIHDLSSPPRHRGSEHHKKPPPPPPPYYQQYYYHPYPYPVSYNFTSYNYNCPYPPYFVGPYAPAPYKHGVREPHHQYYAAPPAHYRYESPVGGPNVRFSSSREITRHSPNKHPSALDRDSPHSSADCERGGKHKSQLKRKLVHGPVRGRGHGDEHDHGYHLDKPNAKQRRILEHLYKQGNLQEDNLSMVALDFNMSITQVTAFLRSKQKYNHSTHGNRSSTLSGNVPKCIGPCCQWKRYSNDPVSPKPKRKRYTRTEPTPTADQYFTILSLFKEQFYDPNSALIWLAYVGGDPSETYNPPEVVRNPTVGADGMGGYATAFRACGLYITEDDMEKKEFHNWRLRSVCDLNALQNALVMWVKLTTPNRLEQVRARARDFAGVKLGYSSVFRTRTDNGNAAPPSDSENTNADGERRTEHKSKGSGYRLKGRGGTLSEQQYYELLRKYKDHFLWVYSALIWLSSVDIPANSFNPSQPRTTFPNNGGKFLSGLSAGTNQTGAGSTGRGETADERSQTFGVFHVPQEHRCPLSIRGEQGYADAFKSIGLYLSESDKKRSHYHGWRVGANCDFLALQKAVRRWVKETENERVERVTRYLAREPQEVQLSNCRICGVMYYKFHRCSGTPHPDRLIYLEYPSGDRRQITKMNRLKAQINREYSSAKSPPPLIGHDGQERPSTSPPPSHPPPSPSGPTMRTRSSRVVRGLDALCSLASAAEKKSNNPHISGSFRDDEGDTFKDLSEKRRGLPFECIKCGCRVVSYRALKNHQAGKTRAGKSCLRKQRKARNRKQPLPMTLINVERRFQPKRNVKENTKLSEVTLERRVSPYHKPYPDSPSPTQNSAWKKFRRDIPNPIVQDNGGSDISDSKQVGQMAPDRENVTEQQCLPPKTSTSTRTRSKQKRLQLESSLRRKRMEAESSSHTQSPKRFRFSSSRRDGPQLRNHSTFDCPKRTFHKSNVNDLLGASLQLLSQSSSAKSSFSSSISSRNSLPTDKDETDRIELLTSLRKGRKKNQTENDDEKRGRCVLETLSETINNQRAKTSDISPPKPPKTPKVKSEEFEIKRSLSTSTHTSPTTLSSVKKRIKLETKALKSPTPPLSPAPAGTTIKSRPLKKIETAETLEKLKIEAQPCTQENTAAPKTSDDAQKMETETSQTTQKATKPLSPLSESSLSSLSNQGSNIRKTPAEQVTNSPLQPIENVLNTLKRRSSKPRDPALTALRKSPRLHKRKVVLTSSRISSTQRQKKRKADKENIPSLSLQTNPAYILETNCKDVFGSSIPRRRCVLQTKPLISLDAQSNETDRGDDKTHRIDLSLPTKLMEEHKIDMQENLSGKTSKPTKKNQHKVSIDEIFEIYLSKNRKDYEVVQALKAYFSIAVCSSLLSDQEQRYHKRIHRSSEFVTQYYQKLHLLRFFAQLPLFLRESKLSRSQVRAISIPLIRIFRFLEYLKC